MTLVGILGGVGPAAGILLHQTLLQHTESNGVDQGHVDVCHISRSADIASRVDFLIAYTAAQCQLAALATTSSENSSDNDNDDNDNGNDNDNIDSDIDGQDLTALLKGVENPAVGMARTFAMLRQLDTPVVAAVPCITFHAPPIWRAFEQQIRTEAGHIETNNVRCLHMLDETVRFLTQVAPLCSHIGVLSTTGTRAARVFHDVLEPIGITIVEVDAPTQREMQDSILNPQWGLKSTAPAVAPQCAANFHRFARELIANGAELIVLGCTEIPFAFSGVTAIDGVPLVDPLVALARALIREVDPLRLKPLVM